MQVARINIAHKQRVAPKEHAGVRLSEGCPGWLLVVSLASLLLSAGAARGEKLLRWKFAEGDRFDVTVVHRQDHESKVNKTRKVSVETTMQLQWHVTSVDQDGAAVMQQRFTRLALEMTMAGQAIKYDSASKELIQDEAQSIADRMGPLIGAAVSITMNNRGEIQNVTLSDEAKEALEAAAESSRFKGLFTQQGIANLLSQSAPVLPKEPVDEGDRWTEETKTQTPLGSLQQEHEFKYEGTKDREGQPLDFITVKSTLQLERKAGEGDPKMTLTEQAQTGELYFDAEQGWFVATDVRQKLVTETPYRDRKIKTSVESLMTMKISKIESR